jgi:hypothetical protein
MLSFGFSGSIADVDATVSGEPLHPSTVLLIEAGGTISRVIVPHELITNYVDLLSVGQVVEVSGEVRDFPRHPAHVATELRLPAARLH